MGMSLVNSGTQFITWGDVVYESGRFRIYSGDEAAYDLAKALPNIEEILFATDVPGVLDDNGEVIKHTTSLLESTKSKMDVTGGMSGKVERALEISKYARSVRIISGVDGTSIRLAIQGEEPGTKIGE